MIVLVYHIISLVLLVFVATIWSSKNYLNIFIKFILAAASALGAVVVAIDLLEQGVL